MSEALRQQPEEYFPSSEVEPLRGARSETPRRLADFLVKELPQIEAELAKYGLHKNGGQALCEYASRSLQDRLKRSGFESKILAGDLVVAEKETLEHRVNIVFAPEAWVIIDLTVDQITKHSDTRILIKIMSPDSTILKKTLKEEYNWWFADQAPSEVLQKQ